MGRQAGPAVIRRRRAGIEARRRRTRGCQLKDELGTILPVIATLDRLLSEARESLVRSGFEIRDRSFRNGDSRSYYGPRWRFEFEMRRQVGNFTVSLQAAVGYIHPVFPDEQPSLTEEWKTDIFMQGSLPTFEAREVTPVTVEGLESTGLAARVEALLQTAEGKVPYPWTGA